MTTLLDVMVYICQHYPRKDDLSTSRLTKMIYLADWRGAIDLDRPVTNTVWLYGFYGPDTVNVVNAARANPSLFSVRLVPNAYSGPKEVIALKPRARPPQLGSEDRRILDIVIHTTLNMNWAELVRFVYSTYPMLSQQRGSVLPLRKLAREYKKAKSDLVAL